MHARAHTQKQKHMHRHAQTDTRLTVSAQKCRLKMHHTLKRKRGKKKKISKLFKKRDKRAVEMQGPNYAQHG